MFSKMFGYALRSLVYISLNGTEESKISLEQLSKGLDIPHHFLGKIMQNLVRHGILSSVKGPSGGFYANSKTAETPLLDILIITDGSLVFDQCALGIKTCNANHPCPLHEDFAVCRNGILQALSNKTVHMLAEEVKAGKSFLSA